MRKRLTKIGSRKLFKRTADRTKKINVQPVNVRGGIRL